MGRASPDLEVIPGTPCFKLVTISPQVRVIEAEPHQKISTGSEITHTER